MSTRTKKKSQAKEKATKISKAVAYKSPNRLPKYALGLMPSSEPTPSNGQGEVFTPGPVAFIVLIDIVNSTKRKQEYSSDWTKHWETFYRVASVFWNRVDGIANNEFVELKFSPCIKFIGDSLMGVLYCQHPDPNLHHTQSDRLAELAKRIFEETQNAIDDIPLQILGAICDDDDSLRLKSVLTFCAKDVHISLATQPVEIIGREVDKTFRLEAYAGPAHTVINTEMHDLLCRAGSAPDGAHCKRELRGLSNTDESDVHKFYICTSIDRIKTLQVSMASGPRDGIAADLLKYFVTKSKIESGSGSLPSRTSDGVAEGIKKAVNKSVEKYHD